MVDLHEMDAEKKIISGERKYYTVDSSKKVYYTRIRNCPAP